MNDDVDPVPKWRIGELSIGFHSHEEVLALAESFLQTELFLDAAEDILKRVDAVFGLRPASEDGFLSFLDPPPHGDEVALITYKLTAVYLAWRIASDGNSAVAAFKGDTLEDLRNEIHRVNRDAIDAACNGSELQKLQAAYNSRKDITIAFYRMNRELGLHRAKYNLAARVSGENGNKSISDEVAVDPDSPPPFLAPNKLNSFIVRNLKSEASKPKHVGTVSGQSEQDNPLKGRNAELRPTSASPSTDEEPYLGLVFHHDSTVSRIGSDYEHIPSIPLAPQPLKLLKFIHDAGKRGRTVNELVPTIVTTKRILTTEKNRLNLSEIDIDLGATGQYVVRCTRPNAL